MNKQELERYIFETYNAPGERPWANSPTNIVFRHSGNRKWFAVLIEVSGRKLGLPTDKPVDIVNLKCDPILAASLKQEPGIYPAYHMNKERWISVALDGSVPVETLELLLNMSFDLTAPPLRKRTKETTG